MLRNFGTIHNQYKNMTETVTIPKEEYIELKRHKEVDGEQKAQNNIQYSLDFLFDKSQIFSLG